MEQQQQLDRMREWMRLLTKSDALEVEPGGGGGGGGEVLLGMFGRGVPSVSPNPDPLSDQNIHFPHPFSDLAPKIHTRFQTFVVSRN